MEYLMTEAGALFTLTKWVPALRSGNYIQGEARLRTMNGKFCCLGVACDLLASDGMGEWVLLDEDDAGYAFVYADGSQNAIVLPQSLADAFGMTEDGHGIITDDEDGPPELLTNANDSGVPFTEIADHLETHANKSLDAIKAEQNAMNEAARQDAERT